MSKRPPVIDIHCHAALVGGDPAGGFISPALQCSWRFPFFRRAFGLSRQEVRSGDCSAVFARLSAQLAAARTVDGAVVLALDGVYRHGVLDPNRTEVYLANDRLARELAPYPNLWLGASVHPGRRDALTELQRVKADGAVLIKWLPNVQGIDPADPAHLTFARMLAKLELPLLVHTGGEYSFTRSDNRLGDPRRLEPLLAEGVTVIAAHAGGSGGADGRSHLEHLLELMARHPNLHADISALTQLNRRRQLPRLLCHPAITRRLLYGSDFPLIGTALVSPWFFLPELGWSRTRELAAVANPWDRDLLLKRALGVPEEVFAAPARLLKVGPRRPALSI